MAAGHALMVRMNVMGYQKCASLVHGRSARWQGALAVMLSLTAPACSHAQPAGDTSSLVPQQTIPLANVAGRIDHLASDDSHGRVFVAELGNGSIDVVDLKSGLSHRISGLKSPQGLAYLPTSNELVVASGGDGSVRFFDGATLTQTGILSLGSDADNVRVDAATGHVVVGYGSGALAIIDTAAHSVLRSIALPAHPEGFTIDPTARRAFVNLPDAHAIDVVDLDTGTLVARWPGSHWMNFPMALDLASKTLAMVYRLPARLVLLNEANGVVKQDIPTCGDADDVYFDAQRHRIYVSCGSGTVDVLQKGEGGYIHLANISTKHGARTALFVPGLDRFFVAARAQGRDANAGLQVYRPGP